MYDGGLICNGVERHRISSGIKRNIREFVMRVGTDGDVDALPVVGLVGIVSFMVGNAVTGLRIWLH